MDQLVQTALSDIQEVIATPNPLRSLVVLILSLIIAFFLSRIVAYLIIRFAQLIAVQSDASSSYEKKVQLRRVETYLSVFIAIIRAVIIGVTAFYTWKLISPEANTSAATIGASAFFIVIASATVGMILRDITAGATMIIERWFDIGEFIRVEPFVDVSGVVERVTLRSTKLRRINGEVTWIHNQHIQGVHVTPQGTRTLAVDIFANEEVSAKRLIQKAVDMMPIGTLQITEPPRISRCNKWADNIWYLTVKLKVAPGREWLVENHFIDTLNELNDQLKKDGVFIRPPVARFADERAERSFRRAVALATQEESK